MSWKDTFEKIDIKKLPEHIAIIMDGNGRWAKQNNLSRIEGHRAGVKSVRRIVEVCVETGIKHLTLYAFSTENWKRSKLEVNALFKLMIETLNKQIVELNDQNVIVKIIGSSERLSKSYYKNLLDICRPTWNNTGMTLNIAFNYGGRQELLDAFSQVYDLIKKNKIEKEDISEELIDKYLYTAGQPDPDLLIRTSGELRLSNYLIWQSAYSEFYFTDKYWPDFNKSDLLEAVLDFQNRKRRFGGRK